MSMDAPVASSHPLEPDYRAIPATLSTGEVHFPQFDGGAKIKYILPVAQGSRSTTPDDSPDLGPPSAGFFKLSYYCRPSYRLALPFVERVIRMAQVRIEQIGSANEDP
jgi:hypothetical protein